MWLESRRWPSRLQGRFDETLARDSSDARYFSTHRLLVDTYCLQHPDEFCASAKSLAAHLVGLCWVLEEGARPGVGPEDLHRWLNGNRKLSKPAVPKQRGRLNNGDLPQEDDPLAWGQAVRRWARETWIAYSPLHAVARQWSQWRGAIDFHFSPIPALLKSTRRALLGEPHVRFSPTADSQLSGSGS